MGRVTVAKVPVADLGSTIRADVDRARRYAGQRADQVVALAAKRLGPVPRTSAWDGEPRFALLTVNFSTTRYLKLMLLTLAEQHGLDLVSRVVVADNGSVDGAEAFLAELAAVERVTVVQNRRRLSHAKGMRTALRALRTAERASEAPPANILLFCDTDVVFRNPDTLQELAAIFRSGDVAFAGELRHGLFPYPEAQASFLAVRRDWADRRRTAPWVSHGSPAYWLQRSIWRQGGTGHHFPGNAGGYILHRGRTGVAAAQQHFRHHHYASTRYNQPHFMGIPGGEHIWRTIEDAHAPLLDGDPAAVAERLAGAFAAALEPGVDASRPTPHRPITATHATEADDATPATGERGVQVTQYVPVPVPVRVHLAHAELQAVAGACGADILHIKGPALDPELRRRTPEPHGACPCAVPNLFLLERPASVDADVLVRPFHFPRLMAALRRDGWVQMTPLLDHGLVQHSTVWFHPELGQADLHYRFPGIQSQPEQAFDRLWQDRGAQEIAHQACTVPSVAAQRLILLLHAARDPGRRAVDVTVAWDEADAAARADVRDLAEDVGAVVGLDAAIGRLEMHRGRPEYALWRLYTDGESASGGFTKLIALAKAAPAGYTHVRRRVAVHAVRAFVRAPQRLQAGMARRPSLGEVVTYYGRLVRRSADLRRVLDGRRSP